MDVLEADANKTKNPIPDTNCMDEYPTPAQAWTVVAILCFLSTMSFVDRNLLPLLSVTIAKDLQLTDTQIGALSGIAFGTFYAAASLPYGWALDRYSRRCVIWSGVFVWSLATMACGLARNFAAIFTARAVVGSGEVALNPGSQSIFADIFPPERLALPMSVYGLGARMGGGASFIIGGFLAALIPVNEVYQILGVGAVKGWQVIFLIAGLPGLFISFVMFAIPEPPRRHLPSRGSTHTTYMDYFRFMAGQIRFFLAHHAGVITIVAATNAIIAWTPAFFMRSYGWRTDQVGFWLGIAFAVGPLIGIPLHGALVDRLFRRGRLDAHHFYLKSMLLVATLPAALVYLVPSPWVAIGLLCLSQGLTAGYIGVLPAALQLMIPGNLRGKGASVASLISGFVGMSMGPTLTSFVTQHVFHDPNKVGMSIAISTAILMPAAALLFTIAQKPMAQRLAR